MLQQALELRSIQLTERNPISSRSHAICQLTFRAPADSPAAVAGDGAAGASATGTGSGAGAGAAGQGGLGQLMLVDLAESLPKKTSIGCAYERKSNQ